jgi:hypothetical protein
VDPTAAGGAALVGVPAEYAHKARLGFKESTVLCIAFNPEGATLVGTKGGDVYRFEEAGVRADKKWAAVHQVDPLWTPCGPPVDPLWSPDRTCSCHSVAIDLMKGCDR